MIPALMQHSSLDIQTIFHRSQDLFPNKRVYTKTPAGFQIATYQEVGDRVVRLAEALTRLGVNAGDRVATFAWNSQRHLELSLAVPCMGAVLHTINVRLDPATVATLLSKAGNSVVFVDASLLEAWKQVDATAIPATVVVMDDLEEPLDEMNQDWLDYESLLCESNGFFSWPRLDERGAAGMCFTSGTTGQPKGVVYSHRSTLLHSLSLLLADGIALREQDVCLPVVPQFHANAWGFTYASLLAGSSLAFTGRSAQPDDLLSTIETAGVTVATAVPTVWQNLLQTLRNDEAAQHRLASLKRIPIGGAMMSDDLYKAYAGFGIQMMHCWGMTELSPLGTVNGYVKSTLSSSAKQKIHLSQGLPLPLCRARLVDEEGKRVPHDGKTAGELQISGPWAARAYYDAAVPEGVSKPDSFATDENGVLWLRTGDVAVINDEGYVYLVDRSKDLIKSGGEWISSLQMELCLADYPGVIESAVVSRPDEKWGERPVAFVVTDQELTTEQLTDHLGQHFSRWQVPESIVFVDSLPKGTTGKIDKQALRHRAAQ